MSVAITKHACIAMSSLAILFTTSSASWADIDNEAIATGSVGGAGVASKADTASVPVFKSSPELVVAKTADNPKDSNGDGVIGEGDTITYTYTVSNVGNVPIFGVVPVDGGPLFNGEKPTGSLGAFSPAAADLKPGVNQVYSAVYTLSALDAYRAAGIEKGVVNTATATGKPESGALADVKPATAVATIPQTPLLQLTKKWEFVKDINGDGLAAAGDVINYYYIVRNAGNIGIEAVSVKDVHEGEVVAVGAGGITDEKLTAKGPFGDSVDGGEGDGYFKYLTPESEVIFTYQHTVTDKEVSNG
jgi:uncharacterized repeat protein (TIGR01451 family)